MGRLGVMVHGSSGASAWLIYHDGNLRVQQAGWDNPSPLGVHLWVWDSGELVHEDLLESGQGTRNIPGNYRLRELQHESPDFPGTYLALPAGITYRMQWPG